jgi:predicted naringenin-chalcone synthase
METLGTLSRSGPIVGIRVSQAEAAGRISVCPIMFRLRHLCAQRSGVGQFLDRNGLTVGDVATWAVHPGGPRILDRVGQALDFDAGDLATSRAVLADHGNCSSATILMILEQLRARPMVSGANVVAIGFGPGLTAAAMLFRSG